MPSPSGARSQTKDNILNTIKELQKEKDEALSALEGAGPQERVRLRSKLTYIERRLKWYLGRSEPLPQGTAAQVQERARRAERTIRALVGVHKAAGVDLARTGTSEGT